MLEYKLTVEEERKIQSGVVFLLYFKKMLIGIAGAIAALIFAIIGLSEGAGFYFLALLSLIPVGYSCYVFVTKLRQRTLANSKLYRKHSTKVFNYTLTESEGIIRDFCVETRYSSETKRKGIDRVLKIGNFVYVTYFPGGISAYPYTKEIVDFFEKER